MKKLPINRIDFDSNKKVKGKNYMTNNEFIDLFDGIVVIEKKIDGHHEYKDEIYYENIKYKHTIHYDNLPKHIIDDNYLVPLNMDNKLFNKISPIKYKDNELTLFHGNIKFELIFDFIEWLLNLHEDWSTNPDEKIEGIVVKNYNKQLFGKISRFDWTGEINENHLRKQKIKNRGNY